MRCLLKRGVVHEGVHGPGPQGWSMDRVHRGGPWTWGPCFVYVQTGSSIWVRPLLLKLINNSICGLPTTLMYTTSLWVSIPAKNSNLLLLLNPNDQFTHSILQSTPWNQTTTSLNLGGDGYPYKNAYCPLIFISGRLWYIASPFSSNVVSKSCEKKKKIYIYIYIYIYITA